MESISNELRELKKLVDDGVITQEEFESKKKEYFKVKSVAKTESTDNFNMFQWFGKAWNRYAEFSGRSRRKEYWYFVLVNFIIQIAVYTMDCVFFDAANTDNTYFSWIYSLIIFVPSLAVIIRRLHDTNRSGWWLLLNLIPIIGSVILIIILAEDSDSEENQYGANPKE